VTGVEETLTISTVDYDAGLITFTGNIVNSHNPGEVVKRSDAGAPDIIDDEGLPRYQSPTYDFRDFLFRGDEVHGEVLLSDHAGGDPPVGRSDVNLYALKDQVDAFAAKLQEMQWGVPDPSLSKTSALRAPPGMGTDSFPTTPRYFDRAGGLQGARALSITVGDGTNSWGDFNDDDGSAIQQAISQSATHGTVYVKRGTYTLTSDVSITDGITIIFDTEASIVNNGGGFDIQIPSTKRFIMQGLRMSYSSGTRGLYFNTTSPGFVSMRDIVLTDVNLEIADSVLPLDTVVEQLNITGGTALASTSLMPVSCIS